MLSIILPTFNEKESIGNTIRDIQKNLPSKIRYEIIVVDDNSPDKTVDEVRKHFKQKNIWCLERKGKKGLSIAVIEGFSRAKGDFLLVMDADGQHDATALPKMLKAIKTHDVVIGSRFVSGGSVEGWPKYRLFISQCAAFYAKMFLVPKVRDPLAGFFMLTKEEFEKVSKKLTGKGYKLLLDILFQDPEAKTAEVPISFSPRSQGESKLSSSVIIKDFIMVTKSGLHPKNKFFKFLVVGASGAIINIGLLFILTELALLYYLISSVIAIEVSIITNFFLNNFWTWKQKNNSAKQLFQRFLKFNAVSGVALIINISLLFFFTELIGLYYIFSNIIGIGFAALVNYILNNNWTFNK